MIPMKSPCGCWTLSITTIIPKTTITHPATTTHGRLTAEQRIEAGIGNGLVRVAVGLEAIEDMGYPVVLKPVSAEILHKTEAGAVRVDLETADDVVGAYGFLDDLLVEISAEMSDLGRAVRAEFRREGAGPDVDE